MGYVCELSDGQRVYLENAGHQTLVTIASTSLGQQQQASSSIQTGNWTAPPEVFRVATGLVVKLYAAESERFVQIQGSRVSALSEVPLLRAAQPMQVQQVSSMPTALMSPMQPMSPLQPIIPLQPTKPMKKGDMQAEPGAMSMQMGTMRMSMTPIARAPETHTQARQSDAPDTTVGQRKFCSQCGSPIQLSDRFCAQCGHRLG